MDDEVGDLRETGILVAGHRNQLRALFANSSCGREQLVGIAAIGCRKNEVARMPLAETAVQRLSRMQKSRRRADRAEQARGIARDVFGLPDAGHVHPSAASERSANYLDGARYRRDVQTAAQIAEF